MLNLHLLSENLFKMISVSSSPMINPADPRADLSADSETYLGPCSRRLKIASGLCLPTSVDRARSRRHVKIQVLLSGIFKLKAKKAQILYNEDQP